MVLDLLGIAIHQIFDWTRKLGPGQPINFMKQFRFLRLICACQFSLSNISNEILTKTTTTTAAANKQTNKITNSVLRRKTWQKSLNVFFYTSLNIWLFFSYYKNIKMSIEAKKGTIANDKNSLSICMNARHYVWFYPFISLWDRVLFNLAQIIHKQSDNWYLYTCVYVCGMCAQCHWFRRHRCTL